MCVQGQLLCRPARRGKYGLDAIGQRVVSCNPGDARAFLEVSEHGYHATVTRGREWPSNIVVMLWRKRQRSCAARREACANAGRGRGRHQRLWCCDEVPGYALGGPEVAPGEVCGWG